MQQFNTLEEQALELDKQDELSHFREKFNFPKDKTGQQQTYFCGNSLGLMPKSAQNLMNEELQAWAEQAVDGHFDKELSWYNYHEFFNEMTAEIIGAKENEVVIMNSLTTNLHLLMVSFYRPTKSRFKIVIESGAFPSDQFLVESQVRFHGLDPKDAIIYCKPHEGDVLLNDQDIINTLEEHKDEIALVMLSGVQFRTGQLFDLESICTKAHEIGALCGYDLAHAVGNVPLKLHEWGVDFAAFCTYKYLNSGPGATAGAFVHEKHTKGEQNYPRFQGWWGTNPDTRFSMHEHCEFDAQKNAGAWQLSNAPIFSMVPLLASLRIFKEAGFKNLRKKSLLMTDYLLFLLDSIEQKNPEQSIAVISPREKKSRGSQVSIRIEKDAKAFQVSLQEKGIVTDYRAPNVIRIAPVPMYNSFHDVWVFANELKKFLK